MVNSTHSSVPSSLSGRMSACARVALASGMALLAGLTMTGAISAADFSPIRDSETVLATGGDKDKEEAKVGICHATGSASNPYVFIMVSKSAVRAHQHHQDGRDIIGAKSQADCPKPKADVRKHHDDKKVSKEKVEVKARIHEDDCECHEDKVVVKPLEVKPQVSANHKIEFKEQVKVDHDSDVKVAFKSKEDFKGHMKFDLRSDREDCDDSHGVSPLIFAKAHLEFVKHHRVNVDDLAVVCICITTEANNQQLATLASFSTAPQPAVTVIGSAPSQTTSQVAPAIAPELLPAVGGAIVTLPMPTTVDVAPQVAELPAPIVVEEEGSVAGVIGIAPESPALLPMAGDAVAQVAVFGTGIGGLLVAAGMFLRKLLRLS
ncbi:MAG: hypothetical protein JW395_3552 [Nitrospira sp.]|nr:hypothetical protein [Nitrospira sp.]